MRFPAVAVLALVACAVDPVDYEGRECPCIGGFVCDEARNLCVRATADVDGSTGADASRTDAGLDAGPPPPPRDSGMDATGVQVDSGLDAGPPPPVDAGLDAGPADAGPDTTHCDDIHAGALFCEDFEGDLGNWPERAVSTGASARISSAETYMGTGALRSETPMGETEAYLRANVLPIMSTGDLYVRWWYYLESGFTLTAIEVASLAEIDRNYHLVATTYPSSMDIHTHGFATDDRINGGTGLPRGRWTCVEIHVHFDATAGSVVLYVDDTETAAIRNFDTVEARGLTTIEAGLIWQHADQVPAVLYVDEIVADTAPIGCD